MTIDSATPTENDGAIDTAISPISHVYLKRERDLYIPDFRRNIFFFFWREINFSISRIIFYSIAKFLAKKYREDPVHASSPHS